MTVRARDFAFCDLVEQAGKRAAEPNEVRDVRRLGARILTVFSGLQRLQADLPFPFWAWIATTAESSSTGC
jgi:hypothetical protein